MALDIDHSAILYYYQKKRNKICSQGPGFAYFPAISNGPREECTANFGNMPFK